ncbi:MAG: hypothetical protein ACRDN9_03335 [Streptosporangiaceae bacterium]
MHRRHDREAVGAAELVDDLEHLLLVTDVEGGRRLVEKQQRRPLCEPASQQRALTLPA